MSSSLTSRLKLFKPDPGTGEPVDVSKLNQALDKIDASIAPSEITSTTYPSTPYPNQMVREDDTGRLFVRNDVDGRWDQIVVAGPTRVRASIDVQRDSVGQGLFNGHITGEASGRISVLANGQINWGSGAASTDTNLYRSAANVLATDDALQVAGDYIGGSNVGVNAPAVTSGADTTTSASYVNLSGTGSQASLTIVKRFPASQTRLKVHMSANMWVSGSFPSAAMFGVRINSADTDIFRLQIDASAGNNTFGQGIAYVTGLAAGSFLVLGRWKRASGSGTLNRDSGNWLTIMVEEVSI